MLDAATKCDDLLPREIAYEPALKSVLAACEELKATDAKIRALQIKLESESVRVLPAGIGRESNDILEQHFNINRQWRI